MRTIINLTTAKALGLEILPRSRPRRQVMMTPKPARPPMTLGNMRAEGDTKSNGLRSHRRHQALIDVSNSPADTEVPSSNAGLCFPFLSKVLPLGDHLNFKKADVPLNKLPDGWGCRTFRSDHNDQSDTRETDHAGGQRNDAWRNAGTWYPASLDILSQSSLRADALIDASSYPAGVQFLPFATI